MYTNYMPPALHDTARAKSRQYPSVPDLTFREGRRNTTAMAVKRTRPEETRGKSVEIDAEPLSSEEEMTAKTPEPTPKSKRILAMMKRDEEKILENQRKLRVENSSRREKASQARRSQRKKLQDDPMELTLIDDIDADGDFPGDVSDEGAAVLSWKQPTPKRRKYGPVYRSATATAPYVNIHAKAAKQEENLGFQPVPDTPSRLRPRQCEGPAADKIMTFKMPCESILSSGTTATTDPTSTAFSGLDSPSRSRSRSRSSSTSSLSSVNSIASLLLTQDEKHSLMVDDDDKDGDQDLSPDHQKTARCPFCSAPVRSIHLKEFTIRNSGISTAINENNNTTARLPSRAQQRFCREHRTQEATDTWIQRGYPTIDWTDLATRRVDRHISAIESILCSNQPPSHYRAKLVEATTTTTITTSSGRNTGKNRSRQNLLKYLKEGVLDVVKHGYYGPRGAKVAAEAITLRLSSRLAEVAQRDVLVRDCGAGGFVQAVLVPEMMERWVADDRGLVLVETVDGAVVVGGEEEEEDRDRDRDRDRNRDEIRKVLEQSNEIGVLVNEDEDDLPT